MYNSSKISPYTNNKRYDGKSCYKIEGINANNDKCIIL